MQFLNELQARIWPNLPADIQQHCNLANYRDSTIVIAASSPVWASRIRLMSREILHAIAQFGKIEVKKLSIIISHS